MQSIIMLLVYCMYSDGETCSCMPSLHKMLIDSPRLGDGRADVENGISLEASAHAVVHLELKRRVTEDGHWVGLREILLHFDGCCLVSTRFSCLNSCAEGGSGLTRTIILIAEAIRARLAGAALLWLGIRVVLRLAVCDEPGGVVGLRHENGVYRLRCVAVCVGGFGERHVPGAHVGGTGERGGASGCGEGEEEGGGVLHLLEGLDVGSGCERW
jgi:hypothetical protein